MIRRIALAAAVVAVTLVIVPEAGATEEAETGPDSFEAVPMGVQTAAGTATVGASFAGAQGVINVAGLTPRSAATAIGIVLATPLTVPIAVNLTGAAFGYETQWLGSHLGGLVGGVATGLGIIGVGAATTDEPVDMFLGYGLLGVSIGSVVGSLFGFHLRAGDRAASENQTSMAPVVAPTYEPANDSWGVTAGWQGRY